MDDLFLVTNELVQCGAVTLLKNLYKSSDADIVREAGEALAVLVPDQGMDLFLVMKLDHVTSSSDYNPKNDEFSSRNKRFFQIKIDQDGYG